MVWAWFLKTAHSGFRNEMNTLKSQAYRENADVQRSHQPAESKSWIDLQRLGDAVIITNN